MGEGVKLEDILALTHLTFLVSDSIKPNIAVVKEKSNGRIIYTYKILNIIQAGQRKAFQCTATINNILNADLLKV